MIRIVTVYTTARRGAELVDMAAIRWFSISGALARLGYDVSIATAEFKWRLRQPTIEMGPGLRRVPLSRVRWRDYDVVKTLFHRGFRTLTRAGGADHPFIIAKLGSVVASRDTEGIPFYGRQRRESFAIQSEIARRARYVTVLTRAAAELWTEHHGRRESLLLVPGATEREIPTRGPDPYPETGPVRCLFAGNFYSTHPHSQPEAHRSLVAKLNELGRLLADRGGRLYVLGPGEASSLDPRHVSHLGVVSYDGSWDYLRYASVGVVVHPGPFLHNNESTKIYHYLRAGIPVVCESGFPNDAVVTESGLGTLVPSGDLAALADAAAAAASQRWDVDRGVRYVLERHTWDQRALEYDRVLRQHFGATR
ncbi:MAG TPA: hypothetical protein VMM18_14330 [Gemmatimonadaceae bacterium]|nr:hypothetical protein [Gemmatimonadaceae bacterium]